MSTIPICCQKCNYHIGVIFLQYEFSCDSLNNHLQKMISDIIDRAYLDYHVALMISDTYGSRMASVPYVLSCAVTENSFGKMISGTTCICMVYPQYVL